jgi:hypothetical protein
MQIAWQFRYAQKLLDTLFTYAHKNENSAMVELLGT